MYSGNLVFDFYRFALSQNKFLIKYLSIMLGVHFLYIIGKRDKSRLSLTMFECLCAHKSRKVIIKEFWEKYSYKLKEVPKNVIVTSFLPYDIIKYACPRNKVIALKPFENDINTKAEMVIRELGNVSIEKYYYGNIIDDSLIPLSKTVITPNDEVFVKHKKSFKRMFFVREFLMYMMIGGINTLCGITVAYIFSMFLDPMIAFVIGYASFLMVSYYLNTKYTFKDTFGVKKFFKFCLAYLPSFIIQFLVAGSLITVFQGATYPVYILVVVVGMPLTFLFMRFFSFAKNKVKKMVKKTV